MHSSQRSPFRVASRNPCIPYVAVATLLLTARVVQGQLFVTVGDWEFPQGTSEGTFHIRVSNPGTEIPLLGINLNLQVGDGGIEAGGTDVGPPIVDVDLFAAGALFATRNNGRGGSGAMIPQLFEVGTLVPPGMTLSLSPGNHLLASVVLDLSGFDAGRSWRVSLETLNGSTTFLDPLGQPIPATLEGGTISLATVPEAETMAVVIASGLIGFGLWHARSKRTTGRKW